MSDVLTMAAGTGDPWQGSKDQCAGKLLLGDPKFGEFDTFSCYQHLKCKVLLSCLWGIQN